MEEKSSNCQPKKEEQDKIWSRVPKGGPIPRRTGRLTVGRKNNSSLQTEPALHAQDILNKDKQAIALHTCAYSQDMRQ
jgi:hypothetical protein